MATAAAAALIVLVLLGRSGGRYAELPACDDSDVIGMVRDAVAESPAGVTEGLRVRSLHNITDYTPKETGQHAMGYPATRNGPSSPPYAGLPPPPPLTMRRCHATASTSAGNKGIGFNVTWGDEAHRSIEVETHM